MPVAKPRKLVKPYNLRPLFETKLTNRRHAVVLYTRLKKGEVIEQSQLPQELAATHFMQHGMIEMPDDIGGDAIYKLDYENKSGLKIYQRDLNKHGLTKAQCWVYTHTRPLSEDKQELVSILRETITWLPVARADSLTNRIIIQIAKIESKG